MGNSLKPGDTDCPEARPEEHEGGPRVQGQRGRSDHGGPRHRRRLRPGINAAQNFTFCVADGASK